MRVTKDDVIKINELYLKYKTYAAVARETGFASSTVKKYVDPNFALPKKEVKKFDKPLPTVDFSIFRKPDWKDFMTLTTQEFDELHELWEELSL